MLLIDVLLLLSIFFNIYIIITIRTEINNQLDNIERRIWDSMSNTDKKVKEIIENIEKNVKKDI